MTRSAGRRLVIYGASGYTGRLIAARAKERGLDVALAGRNAGKLAPVASSLGLPSRIAAVDDAQSLIAAFADAAVVVNCAGPFEATARPVLKACLAVGAHYLDVGGEPKVAMALCAIAEEARAGVMVMPGAGFVMAASDFLAAHVASRLEDAKYLRLGLSRGSAISRGSFASMVELTNGSVMIRRAGRLTVVPAGSLERRFDFGAGERPCVVVPWPDPFSAYLSTGVPNIEVYLEADPITRAALRVSPLLAPLFRLPPARLGLETMTMLLPDGPTEAEREAAPKVVVAEAEDVYRRKVVARLFTPNVYSFTTDCVVAMAARAMQGDIKPGYWTPAGLFGPDFPLNLPGVRREDASAPRLG